MSTVSVAVPRGDSNAGANPRGRKRFPRGARLLRHADFERVYKLGRRHFSASMTVFYWPRPQSEEPQGAGTACGMRIGFTVGRALGGAVQRNHMKRRLREAVRLTRPRSEVAADVVINPKKSVLKVDFAALLKEMTQAFAAIEQKLAAGTKKSVEGGSPKPEARSRF